MILRIAPLQGNGRPFQSPQRWFQSLGGVGSRVCLEDQITSKAPHSWKQVKVPAATKVEILFLAWIELMGSIKPMFLFLTQYIFIILPSHISPDGGKCAPHSNSQGEPNLPIC